MATDRRTSRRRRARAGTATAGTATLVVGLLAITTNVATGLIPQSWKWAADPLLAWSAVGLLLVLTIALAVGQHRLAGAQVVERPSPPMPAARDVHFGPPPVAAAVPPVVVPPAGRVCGLPPRNPSFTGRAGLLAEVAAAVTDGPVAVVAVAGLGGIGKTSVALEFAHRGYAAGAYDVVWWVRAETELTMAEDLARLAPHLGIEPLADQVETARRVGAALTAGTGWLLVFDNAPTADSVRAWLPAGPGHIVITSRDRTGWGGMARHLTLEAFDRRESVDYLRERTGRTEPEAADRLAALLGDLPLALAQAATHLERHGGLSVEAYLRLYGERQVDARLLTATMPGYPDSVATTWLIQLEELRAKPAALQLLRLCAQLDPDSINLDLLLSRPDLLTGRLTRRLAKAVRDPAGREDVIADLAASGLVTRVDDARIRIHRLVAQVTRHHLQREAPRQDWTAHTITLLSELFPAEPWEHRTWPACADLAAHASVCAGRGADTAGTALLLANLGLYLQARAEFGTAYTIHQRTLRIEEAVYGPDHPEVALTLVNLGNVEQDLGDLAAARDRNQRALEINEAAYGPDHPEVARVLNNLGSVERQLGEPETARATLRRALRIQEAHAPAQPEITRTLTNLGIVEQELGEPVAARATLRRALDLKETIFGPDHPEYANTLANFGIVKHRSGDRAAARADYEQALRILDAAYGPEHPETRWVRGLLDG